MRWISERDEIVRDADGRPRFSQGVLVDVTAQREAEERVRAERDRARSYLDLTRMLVLVLDREGRIELLNRAGHELLGRADGELLGRDYFETCVAPEDRAHVRARFAEIVAGTETPLARRATRRNSSRPTGTCGSSAGTRPSSATATGPSSRR